MSKSSEILGARLRLPAPFVEPVLVENLEELGDVLLLRVWMTQGDAKGLEKLGVEDRTLTALPENLDRLFAQRAIHRRATPLLAGG